MIRDTIADSDGGRPEWERISPYVEQFEDAWQRGWGPPIDDHLPADDADLRRAVLVELVHVDLEYRIKAGEPAPVESYLARFPDLSRGPDALSSLKGWEVMLRKRHPAAVPAAVPGYAILGEIDRGGMGVVYKARQLALNRTVALKMMLSGALADEKERARFRAETEAIARMAHPNVVQIYEVGEHDGRPYFSMEYVDGVSLDQARGGKAVDPNEAAALVETLARAVHAAHARNVVHRDLKPANVLLQGPPGAALSRYVPKLTDFGLAKRLDAGTVRTQTGAILGTPAYMSPEQAEGRAVGPPTDIYALGVILYELLTGVRPHRGEGARLIQQVVEDDPRPPRSVNGQVPRDLETITLKCLAKVPSQRYASAKDLADDLRRYLDGESILARREALVSLIYRRTRRHPAAVALSLAVLVAVAALGLMVVATLHDRRVTRLVNRIGEEMARKDGPGASFEAADALIRDLEPLDPRQAARERQLWADRLAHRIEQEVRSVAPLDADRLTRIEADLELLARHNPSAANGLKRDLTGRRRTWQLVGELRPPVAAVDAVFDPAAVAAGSDGLRPRRDGAAGAGAGAAQAQGPPPESIVATRLACAGNVRLNATFRAGTWEASERIGLLLYDNQWHVDTILALAFRTDDDLLIADARGVTHSWQVAAHRATVVPPPPPGSVSLAFGIPGPPPDLDSGAAPRPRDVALGAALPDGRGYRSQAGTTAVSPSGRAVAVVRPGGNVTLWERRGDELVRIAEIPVDASWVESLAVSADGRTVAVGTPEGDVHLYDPTASKPRATLSGHKGPVSCLAFSRDGTTLASGGADNGVRIWDVAGSKPERRLADAHTGRVTALAFSPDGRTLATGASDRRARLWSAATGQPLRTLGGLNDTVGGLAFAPGGGRLAVGYGRWVTLVDLKGGRPAEVLRPQFYALRVVVPPAHGVKGRAWTLGDSAAGRRPVQVELRRTDEVLREQPITLAAGGPLDLSARLEGDRLTLRVNGTEVFFQDSFPLGRSPGGVFGVEWPAPARLERLEASVQAVPDVRSGMEEGDEFFAAESFDKALDAYAALRVVATEPRVVQEARFKEAMCLLRLNRKEEAEQAFVALTGEPQGDRWPVAAACYLWLLRLRQPDRRDEADLVYQQLASVYPREQLAAYVPVGVPAEIVRIYSADSSLTWIDPDDRLLPQINRAIEIADYLQAPAAQRKALKLSLAEAYQGFNQLDLARKEYAELLDSPAADPSAEALYLEMYSWVLGLLNRHDDALAELARRLEPGRGADPALHVTRARVYAQKGRWAEARADLDAFFGGPSPQASESYYDACLLRGFVRDALHDPEGAKASWRDGYRAASGRNHMRILSVAIQASLCEGLTREDARIMYDSVLESLPTNVPLMTIVRLQDFGFDEIAHGLQTAWRTEKGREYARRIATHDIPLGELFQVQVPVTVAEVCHWGALDDQPHPDDVALVWELCDRLYQGYRDRKLNRNQMVQLVTVWAARGGGRLVWSQVAPAIEPDTRRYIAYLMGRRYGKQGRPADAQFFLTAALDGAGEKSLLRRRALAALDRLGRQP